MAIIPFAISDDRPNIVFLMSDDQCTFSMGCYGNPDVQTPNLDQLALDGIAFDNHCDDAESSIHDSLPLINVWGPKEVHSLGIVTKDWKYIYWPSDQGKFEPTEELYKTDDDPLERTNLAAIVSAADDLERMQIRYDARLEHWKQAAVPFHDYQGLDRVFARKRPR